MKNALKGLLWVIAVMALIGWLYKGCSVNPNSVSDCKNLLCDGFYADDDMHGEPLIGSEGFWQFKKDGTFQVVHFGGVTESGTWKLAEHTQGVFRDITITIHDVMYTASLQVEHPPSLSIDGYDGGKTIMLYHYNENQWK